MLTEPAAASSLLVDLRARLGENLSLATEPAWEHSRLAWNLITDQRPAVVVMPGGDEDVVAALTYARAAGLKVAVQGTGHGAGPTLGNLEGRLLLQMSRLREVAIDVASRRVRVGAGAVWDDVAQAAAPHGLGALTGSSPNVGVVGYSLGGGVGWLGRRHGLAAGSVLSARVVLPDGRIVEADLDNEPELFWALRGGGGSFGVFSAEIQLYPVGTPYAGFMLWPVERAAEVLHSWLAWTRQVSDAVTTSGRVLQFPPLPIIPEPMRGRAFVSICGAILAPEAEARAILQPLRDLDPETDTFALVPPAALGRISLDPEDPLPAVADGLLLAGFDAQGLEAFLSVAPPRAHTPLAMIEIRHFGGALSASAPSDGVVGALPGDYGVFAVGPAFSPELHTAGEASVESLKQALEPWKAPLQYMNFSHAPMPAEAFFTASDAARLRATRAAYDPDRVLLSNRPLD